MKICCICGNEKPLEEYYLAHYGKGYQSSCKKCLNNKRKLWAKENRERHNENNRRWLKKKVYNERPH